MWARVEQGKAVEFTDIDPEGRFPVHLRWVSCPAGTSYGDLYDGSGGWSRPTDEGEQD